MYVFLLLLLLPSAFAVNDEIRFFKYPRSLIPAASTDDFAIVNASSIMVERTKEDVFKSFKFSTTVMGFIFDNYSGNVTKALLRKRGGTNFTNNIGELVRDNRFTFYEQIPVSLDNEVFMYKFFDIEHIEGFIPKDYVCLTSASFTNCEDIPRCMGKVEGECLVSTVSRNQPLVASDKVYLQKRRVHRQVSAIQNNFVLFWSIYGTSMAVLILVPSVLKLVTCRSAFTGSRTETKTRISAIY